MKKILAIGLVILTTACADNQSMLFDYGTTNTKEVQALDPSIGYQALDKAALCCKSLSELNYQKITAPGKIEFNITQNNSAFTFSTGKSFVKGFALPEANGVIKIAVSAPIIDSVFVPTLLILDEQYKPIQVYGEESIHYDNSSLFNVSRFFGEIELSALQTENRQAKYLLILTTEKAMKSTTTLPAPDPSAVELGRADTVYKIHSNEPLPHTATGAVKLVIDYQANNQKSAQYMVKEIATADSQKAKALLVKEEITTTNTAKKVIQPETEAMFIQLIVQAVEKGELDKALRFVEEAELAGSNKARDVLLDALKKNKK